MKEIHEFCAFIRLNPEAATPVWLLIPLIMGILMNFI